ncbi:uncharacterized protein EI90DRAFT_3083733 [Cantharellus anzutake]|uniref:uncharacterized protein n=1 Tax=Cantharellus anzutake TaxID=1750568 RepID=UPI001907BFFD|nr:uncharacterized protein EI90DRAFT_3083733 [Cantharellus anzutake]KAF8318287.1 hypothetical protein EI90DRAFT_3083733 [Cantharellus anzutake]
MATATPRRVFVEIPFDSVRRNASQASTPLRLTSPLKRKVDVFGITNENLVSGSPNFAKLPSQPATKKTRLDAPPAKKRAIDALDASNEAKKRRSTRPKTVLSPSCPRWMPMNKSLSREAVEDRIQIREFCYRFSRVLGLTKKHVESLDYFDTFSDQTCKAIVISLVTLISRDESDREANSIFRNVLKTIKSPRANLEDVWRAVESLKDILYSHLETPAPVSAQLIERTRLTRRSGETLIDSSQLIPVILSLIEETVKTRFIRQEFDDGMEKVAEVNKKKATELKNIAERWSVTRQELRKAIEQAPKPERGNLSEKLTVARGKHKTELLQSRVSHATGLQACRLRYQPLGVDSSGRIYHALSHPNNPATGPRRSRASLSHRTRESMKNWAYFVFVWGKRPEDAHRSAEDDEDEDENESERWWIFSDAASIRQLADWLSCTSIPPDTASSTAVSSATGFARNTPRSSELQDPDNGGDDTTETKNSDRRIPPHIRDLCKDLNEFADFLDVCFPPEK